LAFDGQASKFEQAPVQSDPAALARLVNFTDLLPCSRVFDVGCGPGLVAEAFLTRGHWVVGVDLSEQMVIRARERCARFGQRATFEQGSVHDSKLQSFDAVVSRFVAHHAPDPLLLVRAQLAHVRTGGVVVVYDHTTDPRLSWTSTSGSTAGRRVRASQRFGPCCFREPREASRPRRELMEDSPCTAFARWFAESGRLDRAVLGQRQSSQ